MLHDKEEYKDRKQIVLPIIAVDMQGSMRTFWQGLVDLSKPDENGETVDTGVIGFMLNGCLLVHITDEDPAVEYWIDLRQLPELVLKAHKELTKDAEETQETTDTETTG